MRESMILLKDCAEQAKQMSISSIWIAQDICQMGDLSQITGI